MNAALDVLLELPDPLPPQATLTAIGICLAHEMDVREAIERIGEDRVQKSWLEAPDPRGDDAGRLLACMAAKSRMDADDEAMEQALVLTSAGWESIDPRPAHLPAPKNVMEKTAVASWKWRRPGKRPGRQGKLFLSTNQAWRALMRERGEL